MEPDPTPTTDRTIDLWRYYTDRAVTVLLVAAMNARGRAHRSKASSTPASADADVSVAVLLATYGQHVRLNTTGGRMDPEQFARRILGLSPNDTGIPVRSLDGVAAVRLRPCVGCGTPTDRVTFDPYTLEPEPPRCAACADADWDVRVELAPDA